MLRSYGPWQDGLLDKKDYGQVSQFVCGVIVYSVVATNLGAASELHKDGHRILGFGYYEL